MNQPEVENAAWSGFVLFYLRCFIILFYSSSVTAVPSSVGGWMLIDPVFSHYSSSR